MKEQMFEIMHRFLEHDFLKDKIILVIIGSLLFIAAGIVFNKKGWYLIHLIFVLAGTIALAFAYRNAQQEAYDKGRSGAFSIQEKWKMNKHITNKQNNDEESRNASTLDESFTD